MRRALACLGALGSISFSPAEVRARPADFSVRLEYAAARGCPDAEALEAVVSARLGYDPFSPAASDQVSVRISARGAALEGKMEWRDAAGKWAGDRAFRVGSGECRGLTRTMGLALAVQIQLLADARAAARSNAAPTPEPAEPSSEAPAPASTPSEPAPTTADKLTPAKVAPDALAAPRAPAEAEAEAPQDPQAEITSPPNGSGPVFALGVGTGVAFGMSSKVVPLGRIFGSAAWRQFALELGAELDSSSTTRRADGAGFSQRALLATAAACASHAPWNLCLVAKGGAVHMEGREVDLSSSASVSLFDAGARVGFIQPLIGPISVGARAEGVIHLNRWTARLDELPVWTAPRFAAALGIDALVQLF